MKGRRKKKEAKKRKDEGRWVGGREVVAREGEIFHLLVQSTEVHNDHHRGRLKLSSKNQKLDPRVPHE